MAGLCAVLLAGCARGKGEATEPLEPPPPGAEGVPEGDRARDNLREIFDRCAPALAAARENMKAADRFDRWTAVGAAAVAYLGMAADRVEGDEDELGGSCEPGEHLESSGCVEAQAAPMVPVPVAGTRGLEPTPHGDRVRKESETEIRSITDLLDDMDEMLVAEPDTARWSDETWERWEGLRTAVHARCK